MSMSVKGVEQRIYFAIVPFTLVIGTALAVWFALFSNGDKKMDRVTLPHFNYQAPERTTARFHVDLDHSSSEPDREIFLVSSRTVGKKKSLDMNEVTLGLVIVKGQKRLCLTNGVLYREGEGNDDFTVQSIKSNGVLYQIGDETVFLQAGEKVNVDGEGNVREPGQ